MTDLHASPDLISDNVRPTDAAPDGLRRFRGSTVDEALDAAKRDLGDDLEIVEANRIRRGGLGGFFATDLGIEVIVAAPTPTDTNTTTPDSPSLDAEPSVLDAVDRILDRHDAKLGDRFVPSGAGADVDGAAPTGDPHPFATQLARELSSNGLDETTSHDLDDSHDDDTHDRGLRREFLSASRFEAAPVDTPSRPSVFDDEAVDNEADDDTTVMTEADDDALADIDQLLLRAGITPPADSTSTSTNPPATISTPAVATPAVLPPSQLLTRTAEMLSQQLATIDPQTANGPRGLKKIQVKISSPDGTSVEMIAEWNDDE